MHTRSMWGMGHAVWDDIKILGHCSVSVCQYVCLCVQSGTLSKFLRCPIPGILRVTRLSIFPPEDQGSAAEDTSLDEIWNAHVEQLIACDLCARTFFPDRIGRHRATCLGIQGRNSFDSCNLGCKQVWGNFNTRALKVQTGDVSKLRT